jgi:endonuclease/exonuclease/phosphatase family metal-dependent hydrolase
MPLNLRAVLIALVLSGSICFGQAEGAKAPEAAESARATAVQPAAGSAAGPVSGPVTIRVATFNLEDVRTEDLKNKDHPRLKRLAEIIQRLRPNVILLNEIAYDMPGAPGFTEADVPGTNAQRFAETFLAVAQAPDVQPMKFKAFMAPTNTGVPSGFDLDNDGRAVMTYPPPPGTKADGSPGDQTPEGRAYGNDCWGFGTFPGQYAMGLLVDERLEILTDKARTFRLLPWDYMPGAFLPGTKENPDDAGAWFSAEEKAVARLSSKSHWDVPVRLPNGRVIHMLCSHPTPPAFDGPEGRNKRRNHDEIRFWIDYLENQSWIVDDDNKPGGLEQGAMFVILGDLNADPGQGRGSSFKNPMGKLLASARVNSAVRPVSDVAVPRLEPDMTAMFRLRVDYVLPSKGLEVGASGVWRMAPGGGAFPSDHFPVWVEVTAPAAEAPAAESPAEHR